MLRIEVSFLIGGDQSTGHQDNRRLPKKLKPGRARASSFPRCFGNKGCSATKKSENCRTNGAYLTSEVSGEIDRNQN
jgi:hypothetical protein